MAIKGLVLYGLARLFHLEAANRWLFTLGLAQAGEFGFVLLSFSLQNHVIPSELASTLALVVALSMLLTPALFILYDKLVLSVMSESQVQESGHIDEAGTVIIAGSGRFGQIVNRLLVASDVKTVVLDHEAEIIDMLSRFGIKSYYGDASRPELLQAAGISSAKALVIAIDDRERAVELVDYVRRHYPQVKTLARAYDVNHLYLLNKAGVDIAVREMFDGSLEIGKAALKAIGMHPFKVEKMSQAFRKHDQAGLDSLYELWDEDTAMSSNKAFLARARAHGATLKDMMESDRLQLHDRSERGWTPPPKGYAEKFDE
jgi:voltage-gated potassium channel Kch